METGLDRRAMIPHPGEPRPEDLPLDDEYAVRPDYYNANLRQLAEAIGCIMFTGVMCEDGGHYGASDATHCRLTLPDDFTEIGDILHIGDGSREWRVEITVENAIEFTDTNLVDGTSGGTDYDTIKDNLLLWCVAKTKLSKPVTKNEICLGNFADGLHADDIQRSAAHTDTIDTLFTSYEVQHNFAPGTSHDGTHKDSIIDNNHLVKSTVLRSQGSLNLVANGFFLVNGEPSSDYWEAIGGATLTPDETVTCSSFPKNYCQVDTTDVNQGLRQKVDDIEAGIPLKMSCYMKGAAGGENVRLMMNTDSGSVHDDVELTTTWTRYDLTWDAPDDQCSFYARAMSLDTGASTFYIAMISVSFGDVPQYPERSPKDNVFDLAVPITAYIHTLVAASDIVVATWTPQNDIKILRVDAYATRAVDANCTIRLTDGADNVDTVILSGQCSGSNTAGTQEYDAGLPLQIQVPANAVSSGGLCTVVIQYRKI